MFLFRLKFDIPCLLQETFRLVGLFLAVCIPLLLYFTSPGRERERENLGIWPEGSGTPNYPPRSGQEHRGGRLVPTQQPGASLLYQEEAQSLGSVRKFSG